MRILIALLVVLMIWVILNTLIYIWSEDYRSFIRGIKYGEEEKVIERKIESQELQEIKEEADGDIEEMLEIVQKRHKWMTFLEVFEQKKEEIKQEEEILPELINTEEFVVEKFRSHYDISELLIETRLFGITREYPDKYYEFYNTNLTLYVFPTKNYRDLENIFSVLQEEENFSLNRTNTFWEASFFINLSEDYQNNDEIRIVFEYQKRAFWLKIKKDQYNVVKNILNTL